MITRRQSIVDLCSIAAGSAAACFIPAFASSHPNAPDARFWSRSGNRIQCELCPRGCLISDGKIGFCRNRLNRGGRLLALGYGKPCAVHVDPIEKKPFYHVLPGRRTFSIGVAGCNLRCMNCQNYTISQKSPLETDNTPLSPLAAVSAAIENNCPVIAFTYTEPMVWIEYMIDTSIIAKKYGIKTALVSSGYSNPAPFMELAKSIDFARFDLKSFSDTTYRKLNAGRLQPVLDTILCAKKNNLWVEIINLVVPGWNDGDDDFRALCKWLKEYTGKDTPVHFSRFFPMYQLSHGIPTPLETLRKAITIASAEGLRYVYLGNIANEGSDTSCPTCKKKLIIREGYVIVNNTIKNSLCPHCGTAVAGVWSTS